MLAYCLSELRKGERKYAAAAATAAIMINVSIVDSRHAKPGEVWLRPLINLRHVLMQD